MKSYEQAITYTDALEVVIALAREAAALATNPALRAHLEEQIEIVERGQNQTA